jgi:hypothetical protein
MMFVLLVPITEKKIQDGMNPFKVWKEKTNPTSFADVYIGNRS